MTHPSPFLLHGQAYARSRVPQALFASFFLSFAALLRRSPVFQAASRAAARLGIVRNTPANLTFRRHTFLKTLGSEPSPIVKFGGLRGGASSACRLKRCYPARRNVSAVFGGAASFAALPRGRLEHALYQADKRQN
ncbi:hypothetical protein J2797_006566 [Paraburkholderia terricola]|uniref:Uncharacterized protein n=1 Tax=Paraburkholderia terricola TaxID=169427 RepID=A0ABU1LMP1_9BURK|nr:hypothetical protein [Paraburkholderia terricola]MDR6408016.1 hypothetical protein [Paraburkholderia terricola]MDR6479769.1 hypothetical protein [Paraburkholderia terricola]MDR6496639.1 hypothetical protein [Paraburkholderia terricola]